MPADCVFLPWDSEFFGVRIARLGCRQLTPESWSETQSWCERERIECLYFLTDGADAASIRLAQDAGFRFVDTRITLSAKMDRTRPHQLAGFVRRVREEDIPFLRAIARSSHNLSRFVFDDRFSDRCKILFETWIEKSCRGWASAVFVGEAEGRPVGYLTCHQEGSTGSFGLMAVAPEARARGIAHAMIASGMHFFRQNDAELVTVATQGCNIASQRAFQRFGFLTSASDIWFHKWLQQP